MPAQFCKVSLAAAQYLPDFLLSVLVLPLLWEADENVSLDNHMLPWATVSPQDSHDASEFHTFWKCWKDWILLQKSNNRAKGRSWRVTLSAMAEMPGEERVVTPVARKPLGLQCCHQKPWPHMSWFLQQQPPGWLSRALTLTKAAAGA